MITSHNMRLGEKNSTNLEQLDYLQDLNRLLFSNVVDQAAQKTENYLAYGQSELTATNAPVGRSVHWMGCVFSFGAEWGSSQSISFCC